MYRMFLCACVAASSVASANVVFDNTTTTLTVNGGDALNGLVPANGYFNYFDKAQNDETTWSVDPVLIAPTGAVSVLSNGLLSSPTLIGGAAVSTAATAGINVTASTSLIGQIARTTFTFVAPNSLAGYQFLFYAENDINGVSDEATFTGAIASNDLRLFQFDDPSQAFFVRLNQESASNAALALFGCGDWTGFGTALEAANLSVLSADGSNFDTSGDIGLALQWNLGAGPTATVTVDYATTNIIPEPTSLAVIGLVLLGVRRRG